MAINRIVDKDVNWHKDQADVPGKSAEEIKVFFDQPIKLLVQKINEIIGAGEAVDLSALLDRLGANTAVLQKSDQELSRRIMAQEVKAIPFGGEGEYVGMAEELPNGFLWFGAPENDGVSGYDSTITCCIYVSAPEEPQALIVEHGSFGYKSIDPEGNYALWIFHKKKPAKISLVYRDPDTRYGEISVISAATDEMLSISGMAADAKVTGTRIQALQLENEVQQAQLDALKKASQQGQGAAEVQGITGDINIEDLPLGVSYALENVTLSYINDGEYCTRGSLSVDSGSCIIKTIGQIFDESSQKLIDGAITVHILPQYVYMPDAEEKTKYTVVRLSPHKVGQYNVYYKPDYIGKELNRVTNIPNNPEYDYEHPDDVVSPGAVRDYVQSLGETWEFELEDGQTIYKNVAVLGWY